jgi:uncharacterized alkaline shock family protein YloU
LTIREGVVAKIAGMAAREVEGVSLGSAGVGGVVETLTGATQAGGDVKKGIKAEVGQKQAAFDLALTVDFGYNIPNVVADVRRRIRERIAEMTDLETTEINVDVVDISLPDRKSQHSRVE